MTYQREGVDSSLRLAAPIALEVSDMLGRYGISNRRQIQAQRASPVGDHAAFVRGGHIDSAQITYRLALDHAGRDIGDFCVTVDESDVGAVSVWHNGCRDFSGVGH